MDTNSSFKLPILKIIGADKRKALDAITTEAPLEIMLSLPYVDPKIFERSISITMRTPGDDVALAIGFLYAEGIISHTSEITKSYSKNNKVHLVLNHTDDSVLTKLDRHFYTSSSCGVCGKSSIEAIQPIVKSKDEDKIAKISISAERLKSLPSALREAQQVFEQTGGIHAAGLFSTRGDLLHISEDVGRHNAVDKLIGHALLSQKDLIGGVLVLSGRISFELVHKAAVAGIPIIAAIGAPSSLAIETAEAFDITLIGFLNSEGFNCYHGDHRLTF